MEKATNSAYTICVSGAPDHVAKKPHGPLKNWVYLGALGKGLVLEPSDLGHFSDDLLMLLHRIPKPIAALAVFVAVSLMVGVVVLTKGEEGFAVAVLRGGVGALCGLIIWVGMVRVMTIAPQQKADAQSDKTDK